MSVLLVEYIFLTTFYGLYWRIRWSKKRKILLNIYIAKPMFCHSSKCYHGLFTSFWCFYNFSSRQFWKADSRYVHLKTRSIWILSEIIVIIFYFLCFIHLIKMSIFKIGFRGTDLGFRLPKKNPRIWVKMLLPIFNTQHVISPIPNKSKK